MKRKFISISFSLIIFLNICVWSPLFTVEAKGLLQVGDYIYFGQYNGQPILWRVINLDQDGDPLLFSEDIITYKAFDGAEGTDYTADNDRKKSGSNRWSNSNIREWLNSESRTITFSTSPPVKSTVLDEYNAYDNEQGFLYGFTPEERDAIKPVRHKAVLSVIDKESAQGGSQLHSYTNTTAFEGVTNYDNAYYEQIEDFVFLLSIKELADYVQSRGWSYKKSGTEEALGRDESGLSKASNGSYWLRTPASANGEFVRYVYDGSFVYYSFANDGSFGICPAMYLNSDLIQLKAGDGSQGSPYQAVGINEPITIQDSNLEAAIRQAIDRPSGELNLKDVVGIKELDASGRQVESLSGIEKLYNLETLDISYNKITDLSPLKILRYLKSIHTQYNEITSLKGLFYGDQLAITSLQEINITGNNDIFYNDDSTGELSILKNSGVKVILEDTDETNQSIEEILYNCDGKSKEEIINEVNEAVKAAGETDVKAVGNEIKLTSNILMQPAEAALKTSRQAEKLLLDKNIEPDRTLKTAVYINVSGADTGEFDITLDKTIPEINQVDEVIINVNNYELSFSPQKLKKDCSTADLITIKLLNGTRTQEVTTLDDLKASTNMGQFAQKIREISEAAIKQKLTEEEVDEVLYNGLINKENKNINYITLAFSKDNYEEDQLEGKVTLRIPTEKDASTDCVFRIDASGNTEDIGGQYEEDNQTIYFATSKAGQYYLQKNNQYFIDVENLSTDETNAIYIMSAKGFLAANNKGKFEPNKPITRAELAMAIIKMTYLYDENATCDFIDVNRDNPVYHYIASSKEKGIVAGYADNTFKPDNPINTDEIAKICGAILAYEGYIYPRDNEEYINYSNKSNVSWWVKGYLNLLNKEDSFLSANDNVYNGDKIISRKDAAIILYKLYQRL